MVDILKSLPSLIVTTTEVHSEGPWFGNTFSGLRAHRIRAQLSNLMSFGTTISGKPGSKFPNYYCRIWFLMPRFTPGALMVHICNLGE